jgi:predicted short-subunit dehydrogenase-like oxidoreductase (DUF2520 family)
MTPQPFAVVGSGPVAREIGRCLVLAGHPCAAVLSRDAGRAAEAAAFIGAAAAVTRHEQIPPGAALLLVATADQAIVESARALGRAGLAAGRTLVHFAGSLPAAAMRLPETVGARVASAHPLRPFSLGSVDPSTFPGTFCAVEGDDDAATLMLSLLRQIGADAFPVQSERKVLYHAATMLPLTFAITLHAQAVDLMRSAGVPPETADRVVTSLAEHARVGVATRGSRAALHGPIAHGDVLVVGRFAEALAAHRPDAARLYAELALATLALASGSATLSPRDERALRDILLRLGPR